MSVYLGSSELASYTRGQGGGCIFLGNCLVWPIRKDACPLVVDILVVGGGGGGGGSYNCSTCPGGGGGGGYVRQCYNYTIYSGELIVVVGDGGNGGFGNGCDGQTSYITQNYRYEGQDRTLCLCAVGGCGGYEGNCCCSGAGGRSGSGYSGGPYICCTRYSVNGSGGGGHCGAGCCGGTNSSCGAGGAGVNAVYCWSSAISNYGCMGHGGHGGCCSRRTGDSCTSCEGHGGGGGGQYGAYGGKGAAGTVIVRYSNLCRQYNNAYKNICGGVQCQYCSNYVHIFSDPGTFTLCVPSR